MLFELKEYICPFNYLPNDEDIKKCLDLAMKDNCIIKLYWSLKNSWDYFVFISPNSTFDEIKERIPKK